MIPFGQSIVRETNSQSVKALANDLAVDDFRIAGAKASCSVPARGSGMKCRLLVESEEMAMKEQHFWLVAVTSRIRYGRASGRPNRETRLWSFR